MAFEHEQAHALRIIEGIEQGTMSASESYSLLRDADPTLVHFIMKWLRKRYHRDQPAAEAVIGRVIELCSLHPDILARAKEGQDDPVVSWFEDAYSYRKLEAAEFVALIIEKLEG